MIYFINKVYLTLLFISISLLSKAQISKFDDGFKVGFKEGYCYNSKVLCNPPTTPLTPLTRIGESLTSYQDGYNRGFQIGLDLSRLSTTNELGYLPNGFKYPEKQVFKSHEYVPPVNLSLLATVLARKQAIYDSRQAWIQDNFDIISDLSYSLLKDKNGKYYDSMTATISAYADILNRYNYDLSNDYEFGRIKEGFKLLEKTLYGFYQSTIKDKKGK